MDFSKISHFLNLINSRIYFFVLGRRVVSRFMPPRNLCGLGLLTFSSFFLNSCSTDGELIDLLVENNLALSVDNSTDDCSTLIFYYDRNLNQELDNTEEIVFQTNTCSDDERRFYFFFRDAPIFQCSKGGIEVVTFYDLNNNQVYEQEEPIVEVQYFCFP